LRKDAPFKPKGGNRAEHVNIDGRDVIWYRTEIAGSRIQARETLVRLPDGAWPTSGCRRSRRNS
jgi:hypothetical protein